MSVILVSGMTSAVYSYNGELLKTTFTVNGDKRERRLRLE